jgi:purine-cytosine permease-like protein
VKRPDPLALVVVVVGVGIAIALHRPRTGMYVVCGAMGVAALLRAVLRQRAAGLLVVRSRRIDVAVMLALAVAIGVFAAVTPFHGDS